MSYSNFDRVKRVVMKKSKGNKKVASSTIMLKDAYIMKDAYTMLMKTKG